MAHQCREKAVIIAHYPKALNQRRTPIACGHPLRKIVNHHLIVRKGDIAARTLQTTDTPFIVGRKTIFQIVGLSYLAQYHECLMTYHHPLGKTIESELLRGDKMTRGKITSRRVDHTSLAIYDAGKIVVGDKPGKMLEVSGL